MVALVPPVPAPTTTHSGSGCRSSASWLEDRLGDVVVAPPVGGPLGVGELVQVVPAALGGEPARLLVDVGRVLDEVAAAAVELDQRDLLGAGRRRHDGHERQAEHPGEVGLADRRRPAGRLDHGAALGDLAGAQAVEEQRPGQPVLEAAGRVGRLVLEVELDAPLRRQRIDQQVGVGAAVGVGLHRRDGAVHPRPAGGVGAVDVGGQSGRGRCGCHPRMITHRALTSTGRRTRGSWRRARRWRSRTAGRWRRARRAGAGRPHRHRPREARRRRCRGRGWSGSALWS